MWVLVDLSQGDPHTSPIWHECHWAQLELAFHITFKFLDFRGQPYKGGTDSADKKRGMERQKVTGKKMEAFKFHTQWTRCFNKSYHFGKKKIDDRIFTEVVEHSLPAFLCVAGGLLLLLLLICFYLQTVLFMCLFFICFVFCLFV
jgi:Flp pilus assembly protein TadB